jgi:hypothetical protein
MKKGNKQQLLQQVKINLFRLEAGFIPSYICLILSSISKLYSLS